MEQVEAPASPAHRYRASRPWPVALLAAAAAGGAVLLTGVLSTAFTLATASAGTPTERVGDSIARIAPRASPASSAAGPPVTPAPGAWQIQIGAFRSPGAARAQLRAAVASVPELASLPEAPQAGGEVTRARFGGIASEEAARRLCGRVMDAGGRCFPVAP